MSVRSIREIQQSTRGARRGTIRAGRVENGRPQRSETWLLTSPDREVLEAMDHIYPGPVVAFDSDRSNDKWALDTGTDTLRVLLSTYGDPLSQRYELYGAGGLVRDCDGISVKTVDPKTGEMIEQPCMCSEEQRECKLASRLSVVLVDSITFGSWLLTTGSENAAYELRFAVNMLMEADRRGATVPAILRLEQRTVKKQCEKYPRRFCVPVLDADPRATRALMSGEGSGVLSLDDGGEVEQPRSLPAGNDGEPIEPQSEGDVMAPLSPAAPASGSDDIDGAGTKTITPAQIGRLMAVAREHGVSTDDLKLVVADIAGVRSRKDIPVDRYDQIIAAISGEMVADPRREDIA